MWFVAKIDFMHENILISPMSSRLSTFRLLKNGLNKVNFLPSLIRLQSKVKQLQCSYSRKMDDFIGLYEIKDTQVYRFWPLLPYWAHLCSTSVVILISRKKKHYSREIILKASKMNTQKMLSKLQSSSQGIPLNGFCHLAPCTQWL